MYHAALRIHVREVQQALRTDHDLLGAREGCGEVSEVPRHEGPAAAQWVRGAGAEEELRGGLGVLTSLCLRPCSRKIPAGTRPRGRPPGRTSVVPDESSWQPRATHEGTRQGST